MSPEPLRLAVDPLNPGQFLACCGAFELAHRLSQPQARAWFEDGEFVIDSAATFADIVDVLVNARVEALPEAAAGVEVGALVAPLRLVCERPALGELVMDGWVHIITDKGQVLARGRAPWNFWSGQMTSTGIWASLRGALQQQREALIAGQLLAFRQLHPLTGRFGFDPGAAWQALDVGFSPNTQTLPVSSSPLVEMLAAVGLQRFAPPVSDDRSAFQYATWAGRVPITVAAPLSSGLIRQRGLTRYLGRVIDRGSYAALGFSSVFLER